MKTIENDATLTAGGGEFNLTGYLIYASDGAIVEKSFKYKIEKNRTYSVEDSLIHKINIVPTQTILVNDLKLAFAHGHKVKIYEGGREKILAVEFAEYLVDNKKAFMTGDPRIGWRVVLKGG